MHRPALRFLLLVSVIAVAVCAMFTVSASAAIYTVTSTGDTVAADGVTTLREAITSANGADGNSVFIPASITTIDVLTSLPAVTASMTITSSLGHTATIRRAPAAVGDVRFIDFTGAGKVLTLQRLRLQGARVSGTTKSAVEGAAVLAAPGTDSLVLTDCTIADSLLTVANTDATGSINGGVQALGAAVRSYAQLTVSGSTFTNNDITLSGRGVGAAAGVGARASGAAISTTTGDMSLTNVTVSDSTVRSTITNPPLASYQLVDGGAIDSAASIVALEEVTVRDTGVDIDGSAGAVYGGAIQLSGTGAHSANRLDVTGTRIDIDGGEISHADAMIQYEQAATDIRVFGAAVLDKGIPSWSSSSIVDTHVDGTLDMVDWTALADPTCDMCSRSWLSGRASI